MSKRELRKRDYSYPYLYLIKLSLHHKSLRRLITTSWRMEMKGKPAPDLTTNKSQRDRFKHPLKVRLAGVQAGLQQPRDQCFIVNPQA